MQSKPANEMQKYAKRCLDSRAGGIYPIRDQLGLNAGEQIGEALGAGGLGSVFDVLTADGQPSNDVLKFVWIPTSDSRYKYLSREAAAAQKVISLLNEQEEQSLHIVHHKATATGRDPSTEVGADFLFMRMKKHASARTLKNSLPDPKARFETALKLGLDITHGLSVLQKRLHCVHRDVSLNNVLYIDHPYTDLADPYLYNDFLLCDMNTVVELDDTLEGGSGTQIRRAGSEAYTCPQNVTVAVDGRRIEWAQWVDPQRDVYALGTVLFDIMNDGQKPTEDYLNENCIGYRQPDHIWRHPNITRVEQFDLAEFWRVLRIATKPVPHIEDEHIELYKTAAELHAALEAIKVRYENRHSSFGFLSTLPVDDRCWGESGRGYSRRDALYACCCQAEKEAYSNVSECLFHIRQAEENVVDYLLARADILMPEHPSLALKLASLHGVRQFVQNRQLFYYLKDLGSGGVADGETAVAADFYADDGLHALSLLYELMVHIFSDRLSEADKAKEYELPELSTTAPLLDRCWYYPGRRPQQVSPVITQTTDSSGQSILQARVEGAEAPWSYHWGYLGENGPVYPAALGNKPEGWSYTLTGTPAGTTVICAVTAGRLRCQTWASAAFDQEKEEFTRESRSALQACAYAQYQMPAAPPSEKGIFVKLGGKIYTAEEINRIRTAADADFTYTVCYVNADDSPGQELSPAQQAAWLK